MAATATVVDNFDHGQVIEVVGTIAFSGSYVTGGDTLSFALSDVPSSEPPIDVQVEGQSGFAFRWAKGTTLVNGKVKVFGQEPTNATVGVIAFTELAAAAYPAGITGDTVKFRALFKKLV